MPIFRGVLESGQSKLVPQYVAIVSATRPEMEMCHAIWDEVLYYSCFLKLGVEHILVFHFW